VNVVPEFNHQNLNAGHRRRMELRFMENNCDFDGFSEHEKLEMLLFLLIPRRDVKNIAKRMLLDFGNIAEVLDADLKSLLACDGIGNHSALGLKICRAMFTAYFMQKRVARENLSSDLAAADFARLKLGGCRHESVMVMFLNRQNRLLGYEVSVGAVDRAAVYPPNIAELAITRHASGVIMAHNHPGGELEPSREDIDTTLQVLRALETVHVRLLDHIIVTPYAHASMRSMGCFK